MKRFITILAVFCIIAGCIIGKLSTVPQAQLGAIALEAFGFAALIIKTLKQAEKKDMERIHKRNSFCYCRHPLRRRRLCRSYNDFNYSCSFCTSCNDYWPIYC